MAYAMTILVVVLFVTGTTVGCTLLLALYFRRPRERERVGRH